jgi:hypothetical protein
MIGSSLTKPSTEQGVKISATIRNPDWDLSSCSASTSGQESQIGQKIHIGMIITGKNIRQHKYWYTPRQEYPRQGKNIPGKNIPYKARISQVRQEYPIQRKNIPGKARISQARISQARISGHTALTANVPMARLLMCPGPGVNWEIYLLLPKSRGRGGGGRGGGGERVGSGGRGWKMGRGRGEGEGKEGEARGEEGLVYDRSLV